MVESSEADVGTSFCNFGNTFYFEVHHQPGYGGVAAFGVDFGIQHGTLPRDGRGLHVGCKVQNLAI